MKLSVFKISLQNLITNVIHDHFTSYVQQEEIVNFGGDSKKIILYLWEYSFM